MTTGESCFFPFFCIDKGTDNNQKKSYLLRNYLFADIVSSSLVHTGNQLEGFPKKECMFMGCFLFDLIFEIEGNIMVKYRTYIFVSLADVLSTIVFICFLSVPLPTNWLPVCTSDEDTISANK
jgi:hypothetical protein